MENTEYEIDLREIFEMLKKRWLMIVSITGSLSTGVGEEILYL